MNPSHYIIKSLLYKAESEKAQALAALEILTHKSVGIGEHTTQGLFEDAEKALEMLANAEDKLKMIEKYLNFKELIHG
jgi:hypothetical protein